MGQYKRKIKKGERWFFSGQYLSVKYFSKAIYLTKQECKKAERARIDQLDKQARKPDIMLLELLDTRLDCLKGKSETYYKDNKRYFKMFLNQVGNKSVSEISRLDVNNAVQSFSEDLKRRGKTQHKANAYLIAIKAAFNYGIELYDLDIKNPVTQKKKPVEKKIKFIPTDEMINTVKEKCDQEQTLMIDFALETGARIGEILRFNSDDVLENEIVLYTRKSRNSNLVGRKVPYPPCLKGLKWKDRLFNRWTKYPHFIIKTVKELKQPLWAWHSLRHRYASKLSKSGKPLYEIMLLLGHSNLSTTQGYLQLLP